MKEETTMYEIRWRSSVECGYNVPFLTIKLRLKLLRIELFDQTSGEETLTEPSIVC